MTRPLGFRFRPTDEELIFGYLLKKVRGEELPWNGIPEFDLYGDKAPSQIFGDLGGREEEKYYLFTRIKKFSKRVVRTTGGETWHEGYSSQIYDSSGQFVIGLNKQFCFKVGHGSSMKKTDWIMHEFSLSGALQEWDLSSTWVICTVHKKVTETRRGVKRCFGDAQIPGPITAVEAWKDENQTAQAT
ncbi:NAC domain-containing protein 83-like [Corylus avellana]|uniref:NAC domain-containing protein 83-like n=1 Tax=Corylus avellana TaxID=13451 RepID=UPI001E20E6C0|nr:NAC domain-containing protein 83-like [Corylus avellana]